MDGGPLKRNKRLKKIVTYSDGIDAQRHASYERTAVVTKNGAVKYQRIAQSLAPSQPPVIPTNETVEQPVEDDTTTETVGYDPDDVLAGIPLNRQRKRGKASLRPYRHGWLGN